MQQCMNVSLLTVHSNIRQLGVSHGIYLMHGCKRVNHALPGTWHLDDLEHFLCTSTAITTVRTSSTAPANTENAIIVEGTVAGRK